jgi:hypothetical protein
MFKAIPLSTTEVEDWKLTFEGIMDVWPNIEILPKMNSNWRTAYDYGAICKVWCEVQEDVFVVLHRDVNHDIEMQLVSTKERASRMDWVK